ncbi:MAG: SEL1-like repeat protein [Deltaproteobacteria bacterium]|jgi:TPR repeat protein/Cdc6-like AAA superfamily ATPase|nr:SEL1-like repeat protein [Deltaproteobacteria bacterium]
MPNANQPDQQNAGAAAGVESSSEQNEVKIKLIPSWDAALIYDLLESPATKDDGVQRMVKPVFVGREELLGSMVNAISQPDRRGTFLISGYRGAGKTSLVIEAARRARKILENNKYKLLPLVLNVSEVSASMDFDPGQKDQPLRIDARKLLVALLRVLINKLPDLKGENGGDSEKKLAKMIKDAYKKATAVRYTKKEHQKTEDVATKTVESRHGIVVADFFKLIAGLAAVAAVAAEGIALFASGVSALHIVAGALAGSAVISFSKSIAISRQEKKTQSAEFELVRDNSLHQIESDLKDVLTLLQKENQRTIIVLEELDKIDDRSGKQLDAVIRYFKNLFTQAPAIFFFLTDKQYYDLIANKIKTARRNRSYSVEHTFFTNRIFVNRPKAADCLAYLAAVAAEEKDRKAIEAIREADRLRVRQLEDMDLLERFIRVLLFRSQDHLFDLKNEMRRYVRVENGVSILYCDPESLSKNEQGLAAFQFLVEQKTRRYAFGSGQDYANEVLRGFLYAVFRDLGSTAPMTIADFLHRDGSQGDGLDLGQNKEVKVAVDTLIDDLARGGAIKYLPDHINKKFTWEADASITFRAVRRLESYEQDLATWLEQSANTISRFGAMLGTAGGAGEAERTVEKFRDKISEINTAGLPLLKEDTRSLQREYESEFLTLCKDVFVIHLNLLENKHGFNFIQLGSGRTGNLLELTPNPVESLSPDNLGTLLLAYGSGQQLIDDLRGFLESATAIQRLMLIHVVPDSPPEAEDQDGAGQELDWSSLISDLFPHIQLNLTRIPIGEELTPEELKEKWGERSANELTLGNIWANYSQSLAPEEMDPAMSLPSGPFWVTSSTGEGKEFGNLADAVTHWLSVSDPVLVCHISSGSIFRGAISSACAGKFEQNGKMLVYAASNAFLNAFQNSEKLHRLYHQGRIVVGFDASSWRPDELNAAANSRVIIETSSQWTDPFIPQPFESVSPSTLQTKNDYQATTQLGKILKIQSPDRAEVLFQQSADFGDAEAKTELGILLHELKPAKAKQWFEKMSNEGNSYVLRMLADGISHTDPDQAEALFRQSAEAGDPDAKVSLGLLLHKRNREKAGQWFEKLLQEGDTNVLMSLANALSERDPDQAEAFYRKLSQSGDINASVSLGLMLHEHDSKKAGQWFDQLSKENNIDAMKELAEKLSKKDPDQAENLYRQAAEAGDSNAKVNLGRLLHEQDPAKARQWYEHLFKEGDGDALRRIAGTINRDDAPEEVENLYQMAAELNDKSAMVKLGDLLRNKKPESAETWYRRAAELNDSTAMVKLAELLWDKMPKEAETWYRKSAEMNNKKAIKRLEELSRAKKSEESQKPTAKDA